MKSFFRAKKIIPFEQTFNPLQTNPARRGKNFFKALKSISILGK